MSKYPRPVDAPAAEWVPLRIEHPTNRPNFCIVYLPHVWLAFSYETCIAYRRVGNDKYPMMGPWVVRENEWGPTTGKHLNHIEAQDRGSLKADRVPTADFKPQIETVMNNDQQYLELIAGRAFRELEEV